MGNKLFIFTLGLMLTLSLGCKKPPLPLPGDTNTGGTGGGGTNEPSAFVGNWSYDEIEFKNGTLSFQGNDVGTFVGQGTKISGSVEISENPNVWNSNLSFTASIDATFFGQTQNQELPIDKTVNSGTWTESNGEISMVDDVTGQVTILSSSASQIVFTDNFTETITIGQGFGVDANSDVEFTLIK